MSFSRKLICIKTDKYVTPMLQVGEIYNGKYVREDRVELENQPGWQYFDWRFTEIKSKLINPNTIVI